jgi:hypothetical protein
MRTSFALLILVFSGQLLAQAARPYIAPTNNLTKGSYEISANLSHFMTTENVNSNGKLLELLEGESFSSTNLSFIGRYGFGEHTQLSAGFNTRYNQSVEIVDSQENPQTESGVESVFVEAMYTFDRIAQLEYALKFSYAMTPFQNPNYDATNANYIILGDVGPQIIAGGGISYITPTENSFSFEAYYRNPGAEISDEFYTKTTGALVWRRLAVYAGWEQVMSLNNDQYTNNKASKPDQWTGPTELYNSINRSWSGAFVGLGLSVGKQFRLNLEGKTRISANSTDFGNTFLVSIATRSDSVINYAKKNATFKQYRVEANVEQAKGDTILIDKGARNGVTQGMRFDIFKFDYMGGNTLVAVGYARKISNAKAIVKIVKWYKRTKLDGDSIIVRGGQLETTD